MKMMGPFPHNGRNIHDRGLRADGFGQACSSSSVPILTAQILGILLLEVIVTLRAYGRDMDTWRTPFNELVTNGTSSRTGGVGGGVSGGGIGGGASMSGVGGGPQVVHRV